MTDQTTTNQLTGAQIVLRALAEHGVDTIFGYPGGAVLPLYDEIFRQDAVQHILVRHEQAAAHAAEGYARASNKVGVLLVTSGPGATNAVTGLTDALMDSIPILCLTGQVPTHLIGSDAFQEADTVGITRACTKHNYLVKRIEDLPRIIHEALYVAKSGRPGPVVIDLPKDIQLATTTYKPASQFAHPSYRPKIKGEVAKIHEAVELLKTAKRPIFYGGGGIINSGMGASQRLRDLVRLTGFPCTLTLMGLGAFPATDPQFLGMLGMHGTYEANMAMHECDLLINVGARFDDRVTGKLSEFSPYSKKIHIDIDPSSINKNVAVDIGIVGDVEEVLRQILGLWEAKGYQTDRQALQPWWDKIAAWRAKDSLSFKRNDPIIKPQHAVQRLYEKTRASGRDTYITTEVGQHQMWAAQHFKFDLPNRWMTSGGLGTMGYGLPAAIGVQMAFPDALVIDIAGEASIQMNIQELSTAMQYQLPVKIFILNNQWMGMVRQWQELMFGGRYAHSYSDSLPDFVKLAQAYGMAGLRAPSVEDLDGVIEEMLAIKGPVLVDVCVDQRENCYPMIPSGAGHHQMILSAEEDVAPASEEGAALV
ncbi:MAG: acetolactate synthase 3 large subunit [Alphaproteobacteria bacterium]|nr:acetolactate synthase 3 large subunit [Alphaproteobacteria bacterium]